MPGRDGKAYGLRATGSVVLFEGFLKLYEEGRDDRVKNGKADEAEDDDSRRLPPLAQGDALKDRGIEAKQHFTEPPPRFTEATLVKRMEELGIGRPSTYASTLAVLQDREYVRIDKKRLIPEDKGRLVTAFLESFFKRYVEYDFTADLEEKLDLISDGKLEWKDVLRDFWRDFTAAVGEIKDLRVGEVLEALNEILGPHIFPPKAEGGDPRQCPNCGQGRLSLKVGKFGAFIGCSNYPDCRFTRQFSDSQNGAPEASTPEGKLLGQRPGDGPAGDAAHRPLRPLRAAGRGRGRREAQARLCPQGHRCGHARSGARACSCCPCRARSACTPRRASPSLPASAATGRSSCTTAPMPTCRAVEEVFSVGINRAVVLLAEKKAGGGKGRFQRAAPTVLKELGEHPSDGGKVQVLSGRYGPYVKHGDVNATLPRGKDPAALTMDEAVQLIAERIAKGPWQAQGPPCQEAKWGQERRGQAQGRQGEEAEGRRDQRGRGVAFRNPRDSAPQTQRSPPRRGPAEQATDSRLSAHRLRQGRQARDRARLRRQGRRPHRAEDPARRDGGGGPAHRQPQELQGARDTCPPWRCCRSSPATRTAS